MGSQQRSPEELPNIENCNTWSKIRSARKIRHSSEYEQDGCNDLAIILQSKPKREFQYDGLGATNADWSSVNDKRDKKKI
ncbi:MAG: hypothetical protein CMF59_17365 [Leptospiraceae bacterium]|nr:hypothetical protein [Leptospiraceae bacterium]